MIAAVAWTRRTSILAVIAFGGCATSSAMKSECESLYDKFPDIVECTRRLIAERRPGLMDDERAKLYMWRGAQLADAVRDGRISDLDAKVSWQQMLVDMRAANDAAIFGILAAQPKIQAAPAVVKPAGITSTNCTITVSTYGGIATTNCQGVSP